MKNIVTYILVFSLGILVALQIGPKDQKPKKEIILSDTVTIVKTDTLLITEPIPYEVKTIDTFYIYYKDTILVPIPIESKNYTSEHYNIRISGYRPNLDYIEIYPKETIKYITNTVKVRQKAKKWGLGVQLGVGLTKDFKMTPYVGIGIQYSLIRF